LNETFFIGCVPRLPGILIFLACVFTKKTEWLFAFSLGYPLQISFPLASFQSAFPDSSLPEWSALSWGCVPVHHLLHTSYRGFNCPLTSTYDWDGEEKAGGPGGRLPLYPYPEGEAFREW